MLKRLVNLPFAVAGKVARAVQDREDARVRARYGETPDPGTVAVHGARPADEGAEVGEVGVEPAQVRAWIADGVPVAFVDVRPAGAPGGIPGALSMPLDTVGVRVSELPTEGVVVAVCDDGAQAAAAVRFFRARGMEDTWALAGGLRAWRASAG